MHVFQRTILLAALTFGAPLLATPALSQDFSEMRLRDGEAAYRAKRFVEAAGLFRLAAFGLLDRPPMLCQALVHLAVAADAAGRASDAKWATDRLAEAHRRAPSCDEAQIDGATLSEFEARFHRRFPGGEPLTAAGPAPPPAPPAAASSAAGELVTRESPAPRPARRVTPRPAVDTPVSASTGATATTAATEGARLKTIVHPVYPSAALQARAGGVVILRVIVSEEGEPVQVDVVQGVRPDLNAAAVSAIKRCVFEPGRVDGRPVRSSTTVSVPFQP